MYIYIYMYICMHLNIHIYIWTYRMTMNHQSRLDEATKEPFLFWRKITLPTIAKVRYSVMSKT